MNILLKFFPPHFYLFFLFEKKIKWPTLCLTPKFWQIFMWFKFILWQLYSSGKIFYILITNKKQSFCKFSSHSHKVLSVIDIGSISDINMKEKQTFGNVKYISQKSSTFFVPILSRPIKKILYKLITFFDVYRLYSVIF